MTGSEFLTYVRSTFKRTDKDTQIYEAMTDVVMDMRLRFLSEDYKEEAYSDITTIGDYRICLPSDFQHMIGDVSIWDTASDTDYCHLNRISKEIYDSRYPERVLSSVSNRHTGLPVDYCIYGGEILVGPAVDKATYRFQINYTPEALIGSEITSATDPVPFSDKYRKCLRYGVLGQIYEGLENVQEASYWNAKYEQDLQKIIENDEFNTYAPSNIIYSGV